MVEIVYKTGYFQLLYKTGSSGYRELLICPEVPVTYRDGEALESAWHGEVEAVGLSHTMLSRLAQWYLRWLR